MKSMLIILLVHFSSPTMGETIINQRVYTVTHKCGLDMGGATLLTLLVGIISKVLEQEGRLIL